jgi:2-aminoadipate transaminase
MAGYMLMDGHVEKQIGIARQLYARKAKVMLKALEQHMSGIDDIWWSRPEGGMFLWVRLPDYMDSLEILKAAVEERVAFVIGTGFYTDGSGRNEMRLNFSYPTELQIAQGIERIARLVKKRVRAGAVA